MTQWLKLSTAATVKFGPFVDDTDGKTAETALTISQADIRLSKNGGAFAQTNNDAGATHDENGYYGVPLDTTDTGTLGRLRVAVNESGALPVWQDFMVLSAMVYDSLVLGTDSLEVDTLALAGSTAAATNQKAAALGVVSGAAVTGTLTATQFTTNLTEATDDHYNGRVIVFSSGALAGQAKAILDYDGTAKALTTRAFTAAPGNGDAFVVV